MITKNSLKFILSAMLIAMGISLFAESSIDWGKSQYTNGVGYATGLHLGISKDAKIAVRYAPPPSGTKASGNVSSQVGIINTENKTIDWGDQQTIGSPGTLNSIAFALSEDGTRAVEVHESLSSNTHWYNVGIVDPNSKTIDWGEARSIHPMGGFDDCDKLVISADGSRVIMTVIDRTYGPATDYDGLLYVVGTVTDKTITWGEAEHNDQVHTGIEFEDVGDYQVRMSSDGSKVVVIYQKIGTDENYCIVGTIDYNTLNVNWGKPQDMGCSGDITGLNFAMSADGSKVVEIHKSQDNNDFYYQTGIVDYTTKSINWQVSMPTGAQGESTGLQIVMSDDGSKVVSLYRTDIDGDYDFYYQAGTVDYDSLKTDWSNPSRRTGDCGNSKGLNLAMSADGSNVVELSQSHQKGNYKLYSQVGKCNWDSTQSNASSKAFQL